MSDGKNISAEEISAGSKWVKTDSDCKWSNYNFFIFVISGRTTLNIERHCEVYTLTHSFFLRSYCSRDMMK